MYFSLLGDVTAQHNGRGLQLASKARAVLVVLLFRPNTVVRRTEIVRLVWGTESRAAPRTADELVADYVSRLRTAFRQAGVDDEIRLVAQHPGYLLRVDEQQVDWHRFRRLVAEARAAQDASDLDDAAKLLWRALALWHGSPLADVGPALEPIRAQMAERRLAAIEAVAAIELARGGADRVVPLLAGVARDHPVHEGLVALLIRALHATGRRSEAVAVYQRSRGHASELGLDPAEAIEDAYNALLHSQRPAPTGPAHLPLDTLNFTGRTEELRRLLSLVPAESVDRAEVDSTTSPGAGVICVIDGMAGIGKTALAVHAAHRMARSFPDGQLFLDLHGYTGKGPQVEPAEALDRLLRAMGVAGDKVPAHLDDRAALYRDRLAGKRMLILLDNAYNADQVGPLLPATAGCLVLVTSRRRLTALDDAHPLSLGILPVADAITLFGRVAGADRLGGQAEAVERITDLCAGLPLAIRIVAARLRNHHAWLPSRLVERLSQTHDQLAELNDGDRSIVAAFRLSYQDLGPDQRRMFRLLGLVPGRDVDAYTAATLFDATVGHASHLLQELLDAHLLDQQVEGRYQFHDLMRFYAANLAIAEETRRARRAAVTRLLDQWLYTASAALDILVPYERDRRPQIPLPYTPMPTLSSEEQARAWLDAERGNLIAAAGLAVDHDWPDYAWRLGAILHRYLISGYYADALELHRHALRAAHEQDDRVAEGTIRRHLGDTHRHLGQYDEALAHFRAALDAAREIGDEVAEAITLTDVGTVLGVQGRYTDALDQLHHALRLARRVKSSAKEGNALVCLGNVHLFSGAYDAAVTHYQQALAIFSTIGDRAGTGQALINLGEVQTLRGRYDLALRYHHQAMNIFAEIGNRIGAGYALSSLGKVHHRLGQFELARQHHRHAIDIFRVIHHRPGQGEALAHLAAAHAALRNDKAVDEFRQALQIAQEIGDRTLEATVTNGLGATLRMLGRTTDALTYYRSALQLARRIGNRPEQACALDGIAEVLNAAGRRSVARQHWAEAFAIYRELGVPEADRLHAVLKEFDGLDGPDSR